jgi:peptidyl-tRNA hydrolase, PTH1 family
VKVIVGLGNPGKSYAETRHNLGFLVIDRIAAQFGISVRLETCDSLVGQGLVEEQKIVLAKPQTFMNQSGVAVAKLAHEYGAETNELAVVNDDLDLPFGRIRIRVNGGAGGHRGLQSIIENLAGAPFQRVRVGIGRPPLGVDSADFVLEPFSAQEAQQLTKVVERASEAVLCLVGQGPKEAMAQFNRAS